MAVITSSGSAVTTTSTDNNGGVVRRGGNVSGQITNKNLGDSNTLNGGSVVASNNDTGKAISAGNLPSTAKSVIVKANSTIAGQSNTLLSSTGSDVGDYTGFHKTESQRTRKVATSIRHGDWVAFSGSFTSAPTLTNDSLGNDNATRGTRSAPGNLVYKTGKAAPTVAAYSAKYS